MQYIEFTGIEFIFHDKHNGNCLNDYPVNHGLLIHFQLEATRTQPLTPESVANDWERFCIRFNIC